MPLCLRRSGQHQLIQKWRLQLQHVDKSRAVHLVRKTTLHTNMTLNMWSRIPTLCPLTPRLTALVVKALSMADPIPHPVFMDHQALSDSLAWLMRSAQQQDGSFADQSPYRPNKLVVSCMASPAPCTLSPSSPFPNTFSMSSISVLIAVSSPTGCRLETAWSTRCI